MSDLVSLGLPNGKQNNKNMIGYTSRPTWNLPWFGFLENGRFSRHRFSGEFDDRQAPRTLSLGPESWATAKAIPGEVHKGVAPLRFGLKGQIRELCPLRSPLFGPMTPCARWVCLFWSWYPVFLLVSKETNRKTGGGVPNRDTPMLVRGTGATAPSTAYP